jgi:peptide/nickel transport system ATP-binding protein
VLALLTKVGLSHPEQRMTQYPHQLSGGMKQRVLIAIAIALRPDVIIADEPTSALDVTVQKRILDLLDILRRESGTAVLFVTHDLALAAQRADRLLVFRNGEVQEQGDTADIVRTPQHAYTRQLLSDLQGQRLTIAPVAGLPLASPAIRARAISKQFSLGKGHQLQALDRVTFDVRRGSTHALVGESGSGKTTLARILLGFEQADSGQVIIDDIDATALSREARRQLRQKIQFVYQNPFASLDPRQTLFEIIEEPLKNFSRLARRSESPGGDGGAAGCPARRTPDPHRPGAFRRQRQRVAIARALILEPTILVLDEATSALDVTVQAQILAASAAAAAAGIDLPLYHARSVYRSPDRPQRHGAAQRSGGRTRRRREPYSRHRRTTIPAS